MNYGINNGTYVGESMKLEYTKVDNLVELVRLKGTGCALFKQDLKHPFRQISVCQSDYNLLGYVWRKAIYIDRVLPIGLRSAALICQ